MSSTSRALLLVGSLRRPRSSSQALGSHLLAQLAARGWETETQLLKPALWKGVGSTELLAAVNRSDLLVLAFPLYVDSLPALVIRALETIALHRSAQEDPRQLGLVAVVNCGFPEAHQNDTALAICRQFAREARIQWMGGLAMGAGGVVNGQSIERPVLRSVARGLELAADSLSQGKPVPQDAVEMVARPAMSRWIYTNIAQLSWWLMGLRNGVAHRMKQRPIETEIER